MDFTSCHDQGLYLLLPDERAGRYFVYSANPTCFYQTLKVKYLRGAIRRTKFSMPLEPKPWHYATEICTLSVTYPFFGSSLTDTADNLSEMCPLET